MCLQFKLVWFYLLIKWIKPWIHRSTEFYSRIYSSSIHSSDSSHGVSTYDQLRRIKGCLSAWSKELFHEDILFINLINEANAFFLPYFKHFCSLFLISEYIFLQIKHHINSLGHLSELTRTIMMINREDNVSMTSEVLAYPRLHVPCRDISMRYYNWNQWGNFTCLSNESVAKITINDDVHSNLK